MAIPQASYLFTINLTLILIPEQMTRFDGESLSQSAETEVVA